MENKKRKCSSIVHEETDAIIIVGNVKYISAINVKNFIQNCLKIIKLLILKITMKKYLLDFAQKKGIKINWNIFAKLIINYIALFAYQVVRSILVFIIIAMFVF